MIHNLKGCGEIFLKMYFSFKLSDFIKSDGHLSGILAHLSQFYHDLSLVIPKLRYSGCQLRKIFNFIWFHLKFQIMSSKAFEVGESLKTLLLA